MLLALASLRGGVRLDRAAWLRLLAAGGFLALHFGAWIASLDDTSVAISTLLVATSPLWNAAYEAAVMRRRFPLRVPLALVSAMAGLALIVVQQHAPAPHPGHQLLGAGLALLGAVAFAAYLILVRDVRTQAQTSSIVTVTYTTAALVLAGAAAIAHQGPPPLQAHAAWGGIVAMALVSQLLGHTGMNAALRWFSSTAVAVSTLIEPVIATLLALLLFGETLSATAIAGGVVLLASVGVVIWSDPN